MRIRSRFDPSSFVNTEEPTAEDDEARFELRCVACGYGAVVRVAPEACPMCRATVWEYVRRVDGGSLHRKLIQRTLIEHVSSADREQRYVQLVSISASNAGPRGPGPALAKTGRHD